MVTFRRCDGPETRAIAAQDVADAIRKPLAEMDASED